MRNEKAANMTCLVIHNFYNFLPRCFLPAVLSLHTCTVSPVVPFIPHTCVSPHHSTCTSSPYSIGFYYLGPVFLFSYCRVIHSVSPCQSLIQWTGEPCLFRWTHMDLFPQRSVCEGKRQIIFFDPV